MKSISYNYYTYKPYEQKVLLFRAVIIIMTLIGQNSKVKGIWTKLQNVQIVIICFSLFCLSVDICGQTQQEYCRSKNVFTSSLLSEERFTVDPFQENGAGAADMHSGCDTAEF